MGNRRILAVITMMALVLSVLPLTAGAEGTFTDDDGNIHEANIERIAALGITRGCNPPTNDLYCPSDEVTRGQMAAFMVRAFDLTETGSAAFIDDDTSIFEADIERLAHAGITRGCNPPANTMFCPNDSVTRGQMAAFLVRALNLTETGATDFDDDDNSIFEADIEKLARVGITKGCNPPANTNFCPDDPVLRDQMATFLARAYDIYATGTTTSSTIGDTTSTTEDTTTTTEETTSTTEAPTTTAPPPEAWSTAPTDMDTGLVSAGYAKDGPLLYVAGGKTGTGATDRVTTFQRYHMQNDDWAALTDIPGTAREDLAVVAHDDGLVYAFGGATTTFNQGDSLTAAAFDPATDTWDDLGVLDLPAGLTAAQAVSWEGNIWIIGGFDSVGTSLDQVLIYDPILNSYTPGPALPAPRDNAAVAIQNDDTGDRLFVLGGRNSQGSFPQTKTVSWVLNETHDGWQNIAVMPTARRSFVVTTVDDKIQVFGGEREGFATVATVDEYDPATGVWTTLAGYDWPSARHGAAGAQAQVGGVNTVFLAGGSTTNGANGTTNAVDSFIRDNVLP